MRLGPGADIDPDQSVEFSFDGQPFGGLSGDTLGSALMAAGRLDFGQSAKSGRARGLRWFDRPSDVAVSALRGCHGWDPARILIGDGLEFNRRKKPAGHSQSLGGELVEVDFLIVGGGAAGLIAARTAARAGASAFLVEQNDFWGGMLWGADEKIGGYPAREWISDTVRELTGTENMTTTLNLRIEARTPAGWIARPIRRRGVNSRQFTISPKATIVATGGVERMIAFESNDLPGVMTASTLREALFRWGVLAGPRVAVFGTTPEVGQTVDALLAAGICPVAVVDPNCLFGGTDGVPHFPRGMVVQAHGDTRISAITVMHSAGSTRIECDGLAVAGGWSPSISLPRLEFTPIWNPAISAWLCPPEGATGFEFAGGAGGSFSTRAAMKSGYFRARRALITLGFSPPAPELPDACDRTWVGAPLWFVPGGDPATTFLDFARDLSLADSSDYGTASASADSATARRFIANPSAG